MSHSNGQRNLFLFFFFFIVGFGDLQAEDTSNSYRRTFRKESPGAEDKKDDKGGRGTKGGKSKKKKKKADISIPPRSGNEGSLVITLEAKSAQLTSFSNNGFSEPGAPVILDPNSLSLASSGRDLFDQVRGGFIGEGGKIFVDKNGLVEGFDPGINQFTGSFGTGSFLGGQEQDYMEVDHPIITSYKIGSGGGSSAPTGLMKLGSAIKEIGSDVIDFGLATLESPYTPHGLTNLSLRWAANQQVVLLTSGLEKLGYNTTAPSFFTGGEKINGFQFGSYWTVEGHTVESGDAKAAASKLASLIPIGRAYAAGRWGLSALGRVPAALQTAAAWGRVAWGRVGVAANSLGYWAVGAWGRVISTAGSLSYWAAGSAERMRYRVWEVMQAIASRTHSPGMMGGSAFGGGVPSRAELVLRMEVFLRTQTVINIRTLLPRLVGRFSPGDIIKIRGLNDGRVLFTGIRSSSNEGLMVIISSRGKLVFEKVFSSRIAPQQFLERALPNRIIRVTQTERGQGLIKDGVIGFDNTAIFTVNSARALPTRGLGAALMKAMESLQRAQAALADKLAGK